MILTPKNLLQDQVLILTEIRTHSFSLAAVDDVAVLATRQNACQIASTGDEAAQPSNHLVTDVVAVVINFAGDVMILGDDAVIVEMGYILVKNETKVMS